MFGKLLIRTLCRVNTWNYVPWCMEALMEHNLVRKLHKYPVHDTLFKNFLTWWLETTLSPAHLFAIRRRRKRGCSGDEVGPKSHIVSSNHWSFCNNKSGTSSEKCGLLFRQKSVIINLWQQSWTEYLKTFSQFSTISLNHKWIGTRLLSPKGECRSSRVAEHLNIGS